jgi:hypothetical protein
MGNAVQDKVGAVREIWETSQNPLVYTMSGVWDAVTGDTEEGIAIREFRKLDPGFMKVRAGWCCSLACVLAVMCVDGAEIENPYVYHISRSFECIFL